MSVAEKIYSASTEEGHSQPARLAEKLARAIEDDIAVGNIRAGGVLGSLRELAERYSVGRAAFREAVALLERRGLGRLRPGPCGGFVVARPEFDLIGSEIVNYFTILGVTSAHLSDAREAIDLIAAEGQGKEPVVQLFVQCLDELGKGPSPIIGVERQVDDRTLATLVARRIGAEILKSGSPGQRLGSEWDLCERYSVSRATLRQAIRQLQDSGFVECRRGRGNGLVVRDLRGTGSIRLVLAYLIGRRMDPMLAGTILFQLNRFVPALAVSRAGAEGRARLEQLLARAQRSDPIERYDLLRLVQHVSRLADSPILDLFSRCLAAYEARFHPMLVERLPASVQAEYFGLLRRLLDTLDGNDPEQLDWAKQESSRVMLEMSRSRPI